MSGNDSFYSSDKDKTESPVKHKYKSKFEPKVLLYIAISRKGISKPYFVPSGLAIKSSVYIKCLKKYLLPFIQQYHNDNNFIFWPDKASAHYAGDTQKFLRANNIPFVPKERNPTDLPQCRPIEDFFGILSGFVYENGWEAQNIAQLKRRINYCLKKVDLNVVQRMCGNVKKNLRKVADNGPTSRVH